MCLHLENVEKHSCIQRDDIFICQREGTPTMSGLTSATSNRAAAICEIGINQDNQGIQPKTSVGRKSK